MRLDGTGSPGRTAPAGGPDVSGGAGGTAPAGRAGRHRGVGPDEVVVVPRGRQSVRAYVIATTFWQPPVRSVRAQASSVAPVVWTSSINSARAGGGARSSIARRPARR